MYAHRPIPRHSTKARDAICPPHANKRNFAAAFDRHLETGAVVIYLTIMAALIAMGVEFAYRWQGWQLIEPDLLRDRLFESILCLHAQPPLLNLWAGLALKLEAATALPHLRTLLAFQTLMGAARIVRLVCRTRATRLVALTLIVFNPLLYVMSFLFFYPLHETFALVLIPPALTAYVRRPGARRLAALTTPVAFLVLTRSLFHFAWGFALIGAAMALARHGRRSRRVSWGKWAAAALCAVLLMLWPVKNKIMFDVFSSSSWQGYNLSRMYCGDECVPDFDGLYAAEDWGGAIVRWTGPRGSVGVQGRGLPLWVRYAVLHEDISPERPVTVTVNVDRSVVSELTFDKITFQDVRIDAARMAPGEHTVTIDVDRTWGSPENRTLGAGFFPPAWETPQGREIAETIVPRYLFRGVPEKYWSAPVLTRLAKRPFIGAFNRNHYRVIGESDLRMQIAKRELARDPGLIWKKICFYFWTFTRPPIRNAYFGEIALEFVPTDPRLTEWVLFWEQLLYQDFRDTSDLSVPLHKGDPIPPARPGFVHTFPALLILTLWSLARDRRRGLAWMVRGTMFFSIIWMFTLTMLIDGAEGNRMRASLDFYIIVLWAGLAEAAIAWIRSFWRTSRAKPTK